MTNQSKHALILFFLLFSLLFSPYAVQGQRFTSSPYSRFGLGELATQGNARNKAMGGTGIALRDGFYLNPKNPASYTTLDSITFLFDVGLTSSFTELKSVNEKYNDFQGNFEYFAFGFSVKKWWGLSAGVRKITNVGYDLNFDFKDENMGNYNTHYVGSGGINKVYLANAFRLTPKLSVGINANYNWGKITTTKAVNFEGGSGLPFNSNEELTVSNLNFDLGVQYTGDLNDKDTFVLGATFGNKTDLTGKYKSLLFRRNTLDTVSYSNKDEGAVELPNRFGIGLAVTKNRKWTLAADAQYQAWGNVASINTSNAALSVNLKNSYNLALGVEYTPNRFSGRRFFDRVNYRAGTYYNNSHLEIDGTRLREFGITAGLGIPIRSSYMNVAFELGTRGTTDKNLIKERFAKISVSFTLFEAWFQKILYD